MTLSEKILLNSSLPQDPHFSRYYDAIYILLHTGLRISEFVGLTISDLDFENRIINVNHQLQRDRHMNYIIEDTKTSSGTRLVPMMDDVYDCFKHILSVRPTPKAEPMIDGYSGFPFLDKNNMPMVALHWEQYFQHIREKYNSIYKIQLPKITPHVCRHTFCSNMAKSGMNPKTLQYIMGPSDISVTLNTYTHLGFDDVQNEMKRVCNQQNHPDSKSCKFIKVYRRVYCRTLENSQLYDSPIYNLFYNFYGQ